MRSPGGGASGGRGGEQSELRSDGQAGGSSHCPREATYSPLTPRSQFLIVSTVLSASLSAPPRLRVSASSLSPHALAPTKSKCPWISGDS